MIVTNAIVIQYRFFYHKFAHEYSCRPYRKKGEKTILEIIRNARTRIFMYCHLRNHVIDLIIAMFLHAYMLEIFKVKPLRVRPLPTHAYITSRRSSGKIRRGASVKKSRR